MPNDDEAALDAAIMKGDDAMEEMAESIASAVASAMMEEGEEDEQQEDEEAEAEQQQQEEDEETETEEEQQDDEEEEQQEEDEQQEELPAPKKRRTKKDPSAPKRPMSSFLYFAQSRRPSIQQENPESTYLNVMSLLGQEWQNLSKEERRPYVEEEAAERKKYHIAIAQWKEENKDKLEAGHLELSASPSSSSNSNNNTAPKRPMSSFIGFVQSRRPSFQAKHPELTHVEVMRQLGQEWKNLSEKERQPHVEREAADRKKYKVAAAQWKVKETLAAAWPYSARQLDELEAQLRTAPAVVRVAIVVGFAASHGHAVSDRAAFTKALLHHLRAAGLLDHDMESQIKTALEVQDRVLQQAAAAGAASEKTNEKKRKAASTTKTAATPEQIAATSTTSTEKKNEKKRKAVAASTTTPEQLRRRSSPRKKKNKAKILYEGPAEPVEGCPALTGWLKRICTRVSGRSAKSSDTYWFTPQHRCMLRSKKEIQRYFDYIGDADGDCYGDEKKAAALAIASGKKKAKKATTPTASANKTKTSPRIAAKKEEAKASRSRKKKSQDSNDKPKRPEAAYNIFFREQNNKISKIATGEEDAESDPESDDYIPPEQLERLVNAENGKLVMQQVVKLIAQRWRKLDPARRAHYHELSASDKVRHEQEMQAYNNQKVAAAAKNNSPTSEEEEVVVVAADV